MPAPNGLMNDTFVSSGQLPTDDKFWKDHVDDLLTEDGITTGFKKMIGEQVFLPLNTPATPMYNLFAGRVLPSGAGWQESALYRDNAAHFKPKATAEDDLGYKDSEGLQFTFGVDYEGWRKRSLTSDLELVKQFIEARDAGHLNELLVQSEIDGYQLDMESAIEKKVVSTISHEVEFNPADYDILLQTIQDTAADMMGDDIHYNELSEGQNKKVFTHANEVVLFIEKKTINAIKRARETKPSAMSLDDMLRGIRVVETYNQIASPLTTAEYNAGASAQKWSAKPIAIDKPRPKALLMDIKRCEYRPLRDTYRLGMKPNDAGNFTNVHLVWQGAIGVRPWYNAVRINEAKV